MVFDVGFLEERGQCRDHLGGLERMVQVVAE
jgi:hypothetical protein